MSCERTGGICVTLQAMCICLRYQGTDSLKQSKLFKLGDLGERLGEGIRM